MAQCANNKRHGESTLRSMRARTARKTRGACFSCCAPRRPPRRSAARPRNRSASGPAAFAASASSGLACCSASSSASACRKPEANSLPLLLELRRTAFPSDFSASRFSAFLLLGTEEALSLDDRSLVPSGLCEGANLVLPLGTAARRWPGKSGGRAVLPLEELPTGAPAGVPAGVPTREGSSSSLSSSSLHGGGKSMRSARSSAAPLPSYSSSS
mmetsp:Transcript_142858/g.397965  ORF Transcript_142858/g.397965 Transcript_142858/m.397965 type:complete len:214 (+) Transcript_142858:1681-2322(+)